MEKYVTDPPDIGPSCSTKAYFCTNYQSITPKPNAATVYNPVLGSIAKYNSFKAWDLVSFARIKRLIYYPCKATHGGHEGADWYTAVKLTGVINDYPLRFG